MHVIANICAFIVGPLRSAASFLASQFSGCPAHAPASTSFLLAAAIVSSLVLAVGCSAWALIERKRTQLERDRRESEASVAASRLRLRDLIVESSSEPVLVLPSAGSPPVSFKKGSQLLLHCLSGPDAPSLAAAIDKLLNGRTEFRCTARTISLREICVRGTIIGGNGVLYFQPSAEVNFVALPSVASFSQDAETKSHAVTIAESGPQGAKPATPTGELESAYIVVGRDHRIKDYNSAFASEWGFDKSELEAQPALREAALRSAQRFGHDAIWKAVAAAATSEDPESLSEWGPLTRADGLRVVLCCCRLPDGDTYVAFEHLTDAATDRAQRAHLRAAA